MQGGSRVDLIGKTLVMTTKEKGICIKYDDHIYLKMEKARPSDKPKKFQLDAIDKGYLSFDDPRDQEEYMKINALRKKGNDVLMFLKNNYGFRGFFHETALENLKGILETGFLYSRKFLINAKIHFKDYANQGVLSTADSKIISNYCRFYFQYGTPTNYHFNINSKDMVYIVFDWELLYEYADMVSISDGNQASKYSTRVSLGQFFDKYNYIMDWNTIFDRAVISEEESKLETIRKRNAEVCIKRGVSTKFIKKVIFRSNDSCEKFVKILNNNSIFKTIEDKIEINSYYYM